MDNRKVRYNASNLTGLKLVKNTKIKDLDISKLGEDSLTATVLYCEFRSGKKNTSVPVVGEVLEKDTNQTYLLDALSIKELTSNGYIDNLKVNQAKTLSAHTNKIEYLGIKPAVIKGLSNIPNKYNYVLEVDNKLNVYGYRHHTITGIVFVPGNNKAMFIKTHTVSGDFITPISEYKKLTKLKGTDENPLFYVDLSKGDSIGASDCFYYPIKNIGINQDLLSKMRVPKQGSPYLKFHNINIDIAAELGDIKYMNKPIFDTYLMIPIPDRFNSLKEINEALSEDNIIKNADKFTIVRVNGSPVDLMGIKTLIENNFNHIKNYDEDEIIKFISDGIDGIKAAEDKDIVIILIKNNYNAVHEEDHIKHEEIKHIDDNKVISEKFSKNVSFEWIITGKLKRAIVCTVENEKILLKQTEIDMVDIANGLSEAYISELVKIIKLVLTSNEIEPTEDNIAKHLKSLCII